MLVNYYTLVALCTEWRARVKARQIGDVFSQERDELVVALTDVDDTFVLRISVRTNARYLIRAEGYHRARRNSATLLPEAIGRTVSDVRVADRDRIVYLDLAEGGTLQIHLFGPRANAFLTDAQGVIRDAFQDADRWIGQEAPAPRPASTPEAQFDAELLAEVAHRAGSTDPERVRQVVNEVTRELLQPRPVIYLEGKRPVAFSLIRLRHREAQKSRPFDSVDEATRTWVRLWKGQERFLSVFTPLERELARAAAFQRGRVERMLEELARASRAERYEQWGHLLMARGGTENGLDEITLPDLFDQEREVTIPLDPTLSIIENAQHYYDRARRTRQAREHAEKRLIETEEMAREAESLLERARQATTLEELEDLRPPEGMTGAAPTLPYTAYPLPRGYEAWVGRNATQNDRLTFQHARKDDFWLHARGVPGSHVVVRVHGREENPGRDVLEKAASLAAWFSKARTSGLVPVSVTRRKYVRKPKGAVPGSVVIEREKVLTVPPLSPEHP